MDRKNFLRNLGLGGAALLAVYCTGCSIDGNPSFNTTPNTPVDFTLDLTSSANNALTSDGGYIISQGIVVARISSSNFVAVTQICSHQGHPNITYIKSSNIFYCNVHGATYDTSGKGLNSNGRNGLTTYKTALTGTSLRIYS